LKKGKGFTLVELLVGIGIFAILIGAIVGVLISGIEIQRRLLAQQEMLNQLSYVIEYISRALRMAKKDEGSGCITSGYNYEIPAIYQTGGPNLGEGLRFINHIDGDKCQTFYLESAALKFNDGTNSFPLTSPKIEVQDLKFQLSGQDSGDTLQPRVIIFIKAKHTGISSVINLQTSISQRNPDE